MKIFITGGLGFVGQHICRYLLKNGHHVTACGRSASQNILAHANFTYQSIDTSVKGDWQDSIAQFDAVINLAGVTIFKRWNDTYKQSIYNSRIQTTRNIVAAMSKNSCLFNASAIGYYGPCQDKTITESHPAGKDFLAAVCKDWEAEALKAESKNCRVTVGRFGIILGLGGGALQSMLPAFRLLLGGPLGNGKQWFPWMHIHDLCRAIEFLISKPDQHGIYNFCAPHPVQNNEFAKTLGTVLNRPAFIPAPAFMIRLIFGELGETLLNGQRAIPDRLLKNNFQFDYPKLKQSLTDLLE
ncbi:NAD-dependent epimerase/dehydratase [Candidatus Magnetomorum sp. HK-1]|nr:NAD-dependent epimerase/dehydratase [Candidatus Magnetomorum sp. HK-1]